MCNIYVYLFLIGWFHDLYLVIKSISALKKLYLTYICRSFKTIYNIQFLTLIRLNLSW